ncbi:hypothetical protein B0T19DRAFT_103663 [Cercophora scortea]|uniref:Uncharacterized protein n=1 Tax=Cercophora scortea TaxID=314031 RepID=A0AAE0IWD2_9PEZI|nr:hypothetical protein B0T19DRAFT_103663 [Cercophora scortea]
MFFILRVRARRLHLWTPPYLSSVCACPPPPTELSVALRQNTVVCPPGPRGKSHHITLTSSHDMRGFIPAQTKRRRFRRMFWFVSSHPSRGWQPASQQSRRRSAMRMGINVQFRVHPCSVSKQSRPVVLSSACPPWHGAWHFRQTRKAGGDLWEIWSNAMQHVKHRLRDLGHARTLGPADG